ncbi:MAG: hypothetical protein M3Z05_20615, partial [Gemmatimonadota bacterium]|nr:hypothetical protein [Gemmatimonadota bacterium]
VEPLGGSAFTATRNILHLGEITTSRAGPSASERVFKIAAQTWESPASAVGSVKDSSVLRRSVDWKM